MAYDTVISIGGQSLLDGLWRILQPALQSLSNPLPISLPGMTNTWIRIRKISPALSSLPGPNPADPVVPVLKLTVDLDVLGEVLLTASVKAGTINLALPTGKITFPPKPGSPVPPLLGPEGKFNLPTTAITIESALPDVGTLKLPSDAGTFDLSAVTGKLDFVPGNQSVGLPLPSVVPLSLNLTSARPAQVDVQLPLPLLNSDISPFSSFGLLLTLEMPSIDPIMFLPDTNDLVNAIKTGIRLLLVQLGVLPDVTSPLPTGAAPTDADVLKIANDIRTSAQDAIDGVMTSAFTKVAARTGRLIYPPAGSGASCDVKVLPTSATVMGSVANDGTYVLRLAFGRPSSTDLAGFPPFAPAGIADTTITIGNRFLLELLCCLIERLPAFTFPSAASTSTTDINGATHVVCCNFTGATVDFGMIALRGGLSVCLDGMAGSPKKITLVGSFRQGVPGASGLPTLTVADIGVSFTLPLAFDLNDVGSLANLRVLGAPTVSVTISPTAGLVAGIIVGGILLVGPAVATVTLLLLYATCETVKGLLTNAVNTVLRSASLVTSPVAIPSGVFEAFGKLVPASIVVDDLTAQGVLQTPTTPWVLLPRHAVD